MSIQEAYEEALRHPCGSPEFEKAMQAVIVARIEIEERELQGEAACS